MRNGGTITQMETGFLASAEYYARSGSTPSGFVANLYVDVLGRTASAGEIQGWVAHLNRGASRAQIASQFLLSTEHLNTVVSGYYAKFLHRGLDASGQQTWVRAIQTGTRHEAVIGAIIASDEYYLLP